MSGASQTIAVTGASGFVGRWLMHRLDRISGWQAVSFFDRGVGDITDPAAVERRVRELQATAVIHLAAIAAPAQAHRDARRAFEVNLGGTLNLAEAILNHSPTTRLVFAGSSECYGFSFNETIEAIREDAALTPGSTYGVTKASADLLLGQMGNAGLDVVRFRPFNHTGPGQTDAYVVSSFAHQIARIEAGLQAPVLSVGNLNAERDFLDVRDVVDAYARAAIREEPLPMGAVMNLASGTGRRIADILTDLLAMSSATVEIQPDADRMRPSEIQRAVGDASRARELLDWCPQIGWADTLADTLQDWRSRV